MQWQTQTETFSTDEKVNIDFWLPKFCVTKILTWEFHLENTMNVDTM